MVEIAHVRRVKGIFPANDRLQSVIDKMAIGTLRKAFQTADGHFVLREKAARVGHGQEGIRTVGIQGVQHGFCAVVPLRRMPQPAQRIQPHGRKRLPGIQRMPQLSRQPGQRHRRGKEQRVICRHAACDFQIGEDVMQILHQPGRSQRTAVLTALGEGDGQVLVGQGKRAVEVGQAQGGCFLSRQADGAVHGIRERALLAFRQQRFGGTGHDTVLHAHHQQRVQLACHQMACFADHDGVGLGRQGGDGGSRQPGFHKACQIPEGGALCRSRRGFVA